MSFALTGILHRLIKIIFGKTIFAYIPIATGPGSMNVSSELFAVLLIPKCYLSVMSSLALKPIEEV